MRADGIALALPSPLGACPLVPSVALAFASCLVQTPICPPSLQPFSQMWLCFCVALCPSHPAVVGSHLPSGHRGVHGGLLFSCPPISTGDGRWVEVQGGLASVPALQGCVHGGLISDAQELLSSFPHICRGFPGWVAASGLQVRAHALEELLDAYLGKAPGMLCTHLVKQLALNVDVVGPVPALQEGGLGEAGAEGSDQESQ